MQLHCVFCSVIFEHLKTFFYPAVQTYSYNSSKEIVTATLKEAFNNKVSLFNSNDMTGKFTSHDSFEIEVVSPAFTGGVKYGSKLFGKINESENGVTKIKTTIKPATTFYFIFFVSIFCGLFYFYKFILSNSTQNLISALSLIILGPTLAIAFSNIAIHSVRVRYKIYIDKVLIKKDVAK